MTKAPGDGWAYLPEDGRPDRLIRFVYGANSGSTLAMYVETDHVIYVDKKFYDALDSIDQGRVLATFTDLYAVIRDGKVSIA